MALGADWARDWIARSATVVAEHRAELNALDREIGDGDHGENLDRGFRAVLGKLEGLDADAPPSEVLKMVATTLISTVGGASGPLYGTAFLRGSTAIGGAPTLDASAIVGLLTAARDGIVARGKAEPGDKTMIDAWTPAVDAASAAADAGGPESEMLAAAADAAEAGSVATDPLVARKGRASYLGERAVGHRDPGSVSTAMILRAAAEAAA